MTDRFGKSSTTDYNEDGEVTATVDRDGRQISYSYDDGGRLTLETWADSQGNVTNTLTYGYDAADNLTSASKDGATYTLTYDDAGRILGQQDSLGLTLGFGYDGDGNRTAVTDSLGGLVSSSYDAGGRLTRREFGPAWAGTPQFRIDVTWSPDDQIASLARWAYDPNSGFQIVLSSTYSYDDADRLTHLTHTQGFLSVAEYSYGYTDGLLTTETDVSNGHTQTTAKDYYLDDQLHHAGGHSYGYDAAGNRPQVDSTSYDVGADNRLNSDGTWSYRYDNEGNVTAKTDAATGTSWTYQYDDANHLVEAQETVNGQVRVTEHDQYDVFGNRIEQDVTTDNGSGPQTTTTKFAYDGDNVWADLDGSNQVQTRRFFLDGVDQVFARLGADGTLAWYLPDRLGSIRDVTDGTGDVVDHLDYDAFGDPTGETHPEFGDRYQYTGREFDSATGLQYNRARQYDPSTGRWTSEDPAGFDAGDANLDRYAENEPTMRTDPSGLADEPVTEGGVAVGESSAADQYRYPFERQQWEEEARKAAADMEHTANQLRQQAEKTHEKARSTRLDEIRALDRQINRYKDLASKGSSIPFSKTVDPLAAKILVLEKTLSPGEAEALARLRDLDKIKSWSPVQKLGEAMKRGLSQGGLGQEIRDQIDALATKENLALMGGVLAVWGASHLVGLGFAVDAALSMLGYILLGVTAINITKELFLFVSTAVNAQTEKDLQEAGGHFNRGFKLAAVAVGLAVVGTGVGMAAQRVSRSLQTLKGSRAPTTNPKTGRVTVEPGPAGGRGSQAAFARAAEDVVSEHIGIPRNALGKGGETIPGSGPSGVRYPEYPVNGPNGTLAKRGSIVEVKASHSGDPRSGLSSSTVRHDSSRQLAPRLD